MTRVVAAIDDTPSAGALLASAAAVAQLFDATLEAVHVRSDGCEIAAGHVRTARVPLEIVDGGVVESLVAMGREHDVAALVLGTREEHTADKPLGSTALAVVGGVEKPIVLIPPRAAPLERIRRVLLPLEGTRRTSLAPATVLEVARSAEVDVIVLHVFDEASLPEFTDQPQHETEAWTTESWRATAPAASARSGSRSESAGPRRRSFASPRRAASTWLRSAGTSASLRVGRRSSAPCSSAAACRSC